MTNGLRTNLILLFSFQGTKYEKLRGENPQARNCVGDFTADKAREHRGAECTKVHEHRRMRAATQSDGKSTSRKSGDNSEEVTPVPISNTVVKLLSADDTWWEAAWESRTLPVYMAPWSSGQDTALSRR